MLDIALPALNQALDHTHLKTFENVAQDILLLLYMHTFYKSFPMEFKT